MFKKYTNDALLVLINSNNISKNQNFEIIHSGHLLMAIINHSKIANQILFEIHKITKKEIEHEVLDILLNPDTEPIIKYSTLKFNFSKRILRIIKNANIEASNFTNIYVSVEHILLALLLEDNGSAIIALERSSIFPISSIRLDLMEELHKNNYFVTSRALPYDRFSTNLNEFIRDTEFRFLNKNTLLSTYNELENFEISQNKESEINENSIDDRKNKKYSNIENFTVDSDFINDITDNLTLSAISGKLDPISGREKEIDRITQVLCRRRKNNPLLLGEPGVGKTALAEGISFKIIENKVPYRLSNKIILNLSLINLFANQSNKKNDENDEKNKEVMGFTEKIKKLLEELKDRPNIIVLIDEIHTLVGGGQGESSADLSQILKPPLARGELVCIGATTKDEYEKHFKKDAALDRRFQPIIIPEPTLQETFLILCGLRLKYEKYHDVTITKQALFAAAMLSQKYILDRFLPDKALDVLDEACVQTKLSNSEIPKIFNKFIDNLFSLYLKKVKFIQKKFYNKSIKLIKEIRKYEKELRTILKDYINEFKDSDEENIAWAMEIKYIYILKPYFNHYKDIKFCRNQIAKAVENNKSYTKDFIEEIILNVSIQDKITYEFIIEILEKLIVPSTNEVGKILNFLYPTYKFINLLNDIKNNAITVYGSNVAFTMAGWPGVEKSDIISTEKRDLRFADVEIGKRVVGQDLAIIAIARALRRSSVGLSDSNRPIASFLFCGPTGVGKTEITKALSDYYFGGQDKMIRFDMSDFMDSHNVSKLIGTAPGYLGYENGGLLTEAIKKHPASLVLFDEVEKAAPDIFNILLQVLEDGRLSDAKGEVINFKSTIIVMTSNLGSNEILNIPKNSNNNNDISEQVKEIVNKAIKEFFRPEFLNRIDEVVLFTQLSKENIRQIAHSIVNALIKRLLTKGYHIIISTEAFEALVDEGYDPKYGARPLRRSITKNLEDNLSTLFLAKDIPVGTTIFIEYENNEYLMNDRSEVIFDDDLDFLDGEKKDKKNVYFDVNNQAELYRNAPDPVYLYNADAYTYLLLDFNSVFYDVQERESTNNIFSFGNFMDDILTNMESNK